MKKKSKKKGAVKTLRNLGTVVTLKDSPTEVTLHMGAPVEGDRGDRSSHVLVPTSKTMPVVPPDVERPRATDHSMALVEQADPDKASVEVGGILPTARERASECPDLMDAKTRQTQIGGCHYTSFPIQPWDIILVYGLNFWEGNVIKYVLRNKSGKRLEDLRKARHYIDELIRQETSSASGAT